MIAGGTCRTLQGLVFWSPIKSDNGFTWSFS